MPGNPLEIQESQRVVVLTQCRTGVGKVLALTPNGTLTSTLATFNTLSNAVAGCVANAHHCASLFAAATPPGGPPPANVLRAIANIIKNPSYPGLRVSPSRNAGIVPSGFTSRADRGGNGSILSSYGSRSVSVWP